MVTPFRATSFGIDEKAFRQLIERQIEAGIHGIAVAGSTGEGQTMSPAEWEEALKIASGYRSQIHIMASCGASSTWQCIEKMEKLGKLEVHSALISSPPYNKPPQDALVQHYTEISKAVPSVPIMVYNIPGRTAVNILASTMTEIWKIPSVQALKESSGNWNQFLDLKQNLPSEKALFSGDDFSALSFFVHGANGLVSVLSNIAPKACVQIWNLIQKKDFGSAQEVFFDLKKMMDLLFCESNPIPVKWAVGQLIQRDLAPRLPLRALSSNFHSTIQSELSALKEKGYL